MHSLHEPPEPTSTQSKKKTLIHRETPLYLSSLILTLLFSLFCTLALLSLNNFPEPQKTFLLYFCIIMIPLNVIAFIYYLTLFLRGVPLEHHRPTYPGQNQESQNL